MKDQQWGIWSRFPGNWADQKFKTDFAPTLPAFILGIVGGLFTRLVRLSNWNGVDKYLTVTELLRTGRTKGFPSSHHPSLGVE